MKRYTKLSKIFFDISLIILLFFTSTLILVNLGFFIGLPIMKLSMVICCLVGCGLFVWLYGISKENFVSIGFFIGILIIAMLVSGFTIDTTYDGNSYHKMAVGLMKNGWNPVRDNSEVAFEKMGFTGDNHSLWINHYANGGWVIAATFYSLTGCIEVGKAFNVLSVFVLFGLLNYYLTKKGLKNIYSCLISLLTAFSPVMCGQLFTFYNDGVMAVYIMICVLSLFIISDENNMFTKKEDWIILASSIIICGNIKFTGLAYVGFFSIAFYIIWLVKAHRDAKFIQVFKNLTGFFAITVIITVCVVGFSSYVQNFIEEKNPLYPLMGPNKVDIMSYNQPEVFADYSGIKKLFIATFAKTEDVAASIDDSEPQLKIPFTISKDEIQTCMTHVDVRMGGFGPLFSGMVLFVVIINVMGIIKTYKKDKYLGTQFIVIESVIALLVLLMEGSWWARYSGYAYMLVTFALIFICKYLEDRKIKYIGIFFAVITIANASIMALSIPRNLAYSLKQQKAYSYVSKESESSKVMIAIGDESFTGYIFNLIDYDINYEICENDGTFTIISEQCAYKIAE